MSKPPAFQLYVDDFLGGVSDMTQSEIGAYFLLLCYQWNNGAIPDDKKRQRLIAKGSVSARVIEKFDMCADEQLRNARMEIVRKEQEAFRNERSESGKRGAQARWGNSKANGSAMPEPIAEPLANGCQSLWQNDGLQSPSPKDSLNGRESGSGGVEKNPQVTPPTLEQVKATAANQGVPPDCAEMFWNDCEAAGWVDSKQRPIRNWRAALTAYATRWRANDFQRKQQSPSHGKYSTSRPTSPANNHSANAGAAADY